MSRSTTARRWLFWGSEISIKWVSHLFQRSPSWRKLFDLSLLSVGLKLRCDCWQPDRQQWAAVNWQIPFFFPHEWFLSLKDLFYVSFSVPFFHNTFLFKNVWKECRIDFKNIQDSRPYGDLPFHECWLDFSTLFTVTFHAVFSENTFFFWAKNPFLLTVRLCLKCTDLSFKVPEEEGESLSLSALSLFLVFTFFRLLFFTVSAQLCVELRSVRGWEPFSTGATAAVRSKNW